MAPKPRRRAAKDVKAQILHLLNVMMAKSKDRKWEKGSREQYAGRLTLIYDGIGMSGVPANLDWVVDKIDQVYKYLTTDPQVTTKAPSTQQGYAHIVALVWRHHVGTDDDMYDRLSKLDRDLGKQHTENKSWEDDPKFVDWKDVRNWIDTTLFQAFEDTRQGPEDADPLPIFQYLAALAQFGYPILDLPPDNKGIPCVNLRLVPGHCMITRHKPDTQG